MFRRRAAAPVYDQEVETHAAYEDRDSVVEEHSRFDPAAIVTFVAGFALTIFGLIALLRAGFDGFPDELVTVADMTITSLVALSATVVGIGLLLSGASGYAGRSGSVFLSAVLLIAGIVVVAASADLPRQLAMEESFGWVMIVVGAVVLAASSLLPARSTSRFHTRRSIRG